jgi:hypothetical protein
MAGAEHDLHAYGMTLRAAMLEACLGHDRSRNSLRSLKNTRAFERPFSPWGEGAPKGADEGVFIGRQVAPHQLGQMTYGYGSDASDERLAAP